MNLKKILKNVMYKDIVSAYRLVPVAIDDYADDYQEDEELIAENVPCKLSQSQTHALTAEKEARALDVHIALWLYCAPDVDIREADKLVVTHMGQTFTLYAAHPFHYPTHQEIAVRREKEAGAYD